MILNDLLDLNRIGFELSFVSGGWIPEVQQATAEPNISKGDSEEDDNHDDDVNDNEDDGDSENVNGELNLSRGARTTFNFWQNNKTIKVWWFSLKTMLDDMSMI